MVLDRLEDGEEGADDVHRRARPRDEVGKGEGAPRFEEFVDEGGLFVDGDFLVEIHDPFRGEIGDEGGEGAQEVPYVDFGPEVLFLGEGKGPLHLLALDGPFDLHLLALHKLGEALEFLVFDELLDELSARIVELVVELADRRAEACET